MTQSDDTFAALEDDLKPPTGGSGVMSPAQCDVTTVNFAGDITFSHKLAVSPDQAEQLGGIVDSLDNALAGLVLPIPDKLKLDCIAAVVRNRRDELAKIVRDVTGEDPWATNPLVS